MFAWAIAGSLVFGAPALKPVGQDLHGEWESEAPLKDADEAVIADRVRIRFNRDGTRQMFGLRPGLVEPRRFTFDPKADPPTLDLESLDGNPKLATLAIYKIEGDRLTICYSFTGKPRPTKFVAEPGGDVVHYRRVKAKK